MEKFKNIVPSLGVCQLIPKKSPFHDSVLVWHKVNNSQINEDIYITFRQNDEDIPAPTLSEILEELPKSAMGKISSRHMV